VVASRGMGAPRSELHRPAADVLVVVEESQVFQSCEFSLVIKHLKPQ
jgi:hypothetical protein